jgi:hypothetical protein
LAKHAFEPYDRLSLSWQYAGERLGASLVVDARGITVTYHGCDPVGRFAKALASERADFVSVALRFGARHFLLCPGCHRRCRILYFGNARMRCRVCLDLHYASQNMGEVDRIWKRIGKINRRVDPDARLLSLDEFPEKPKRMRWSTYQRFMERHAVQGDRLELHLMSRLMRVNRRSRIG